ncbi:MAG: NUDIX domain-containing protein [Tannerellaceae bacterium]|nr:NUDIX domain-containing protein [Tannerellaceae bacterium]
MQDIQKNPHAESSPFKGRGDKLHPLHQFLYCPVCGKNRFVERNEKAKQCDSCGFVYYFNPSASVACFIRNTEGDLLLVRRAKEPAKGTLDLPGGFIDMYENAEEAVAREVKEEINLTIDSTEYLFSLPNIYPYMGFNVHTLDLFFECSVKTFDELKAADDAAEIIILPLAEIRPDEIGLTSVRKAVRHYLSITLSE